MARALLAVVVVLALCGPASARVSERSFSEHSAAAGSRNVAGAVGISGLSNLEQQVVTALNQQRIRRGLVPLRVNRRLAVAARGHSVSMAEHGYFAHESFDG